jgi:antitoxin (DNA-binding transcriptional repressor) of toxin-antitoxin stability system
MKVSAQYAAEHFDDLVLAVDSGQLVEIDRPDKPVLQLVRSKVAEHLPQVTGHRVLGAGRAFSRLPSEEELERIDHEWKRDLEGRPIFPAEQP